MVLDNDDDPDLGTPALSTGYSGDLTSDGRLENIYSERSWDFALEALPLRTLALVQIRKIKLSDGFWGLGFGAFGFRLWVFAGFGSFFGVLGVGF